MRAASSLSAESAVWMRAAQERARAAQTQRLRAERQAVLLRLRRDQLLARLALLRAAHQSSTRAVPPAVPPITQELGLVTLESEELPAPFFVLVEQLEARQLALLDALNEAVDEQRALNDEIADEIAALLAGEPLDGLGRAQRSPADALALEQRMRTLTARRVSLETEGQRTPACRAPCYRARTDRSRRRRGSSFYTTT